MIIQKYQFQLIPILIYSVFHRFKMINFYVQIQMSDKDVMMMSWWPSTFKKRPFFLFYLTFFVSDPLFLIYFQHESTIGTVQFLGLSILKDRPLWKLLKTVLGVSKFFVTEFWNVYFRYFKFKTVHFWSFAVEFLSKNDRPLSNRLKSSPLSTYSDSYSVLTNKNYKYHKLIRSN